MSADKRNPLVYVGIAVVVVGVSVFFMRLNTAIQDKKTYDQLPPEIQRRLDAASQPTPPTSPMPKSLTLEDIDFNNYSKDLAKFTGLKEGQSRIAAIDVVRLLHAPEQGAKIVKTSSATFDMEGGSVMLLSASGLADDSVHAEEFFLIFEGEGNTQKLAEYGLRVKCARGENTAQWQKTPCP